MLNELKTRNKNDKTFSTAHILKIGHLCSFNFKFCSSHHIISYYRNYAHKNSYFFISVIMGKEEALLYKF